MNTVTPSIGTQTTKTDEAVAVQVVSDIARRHLLLNTLQSQGRDRLDFHDLHVDAVKAALLAAYRAGQKAKRPTTPKDGGPQRGALRPVAKDRSERFAAAT